MNKSEQMDKILPKLFQVKSEMGVLSKDAKNPFFKSQYADLNSHLELIEPLLQKHGLILLQPVVSGQTNDSVSTVIFDKDSGQSITSSISISGKDMQQLGAAVTYGRRFTLGALFGMQAVDDDGNYASGKVDKLAKPESKSPPVQQVKVVSVTGTTGSSGAVVPAKPIVKATFSRAALTQKPDGDL